MEDMPSQIFENETTSLCVKSELEQQTERGGAAIE